MAIRKNGSRFSDRNAIRRMTEQGYPVSVIASALSITEEHVAYVIAEWPAASERRKQLATANSSAESSGASKIPEHEMARLKQQLRQELLAELTGDIAVAKPAPKPAPEIRKTKSRDTAAAAMPAPAPEAAPESEQKQVPRTRGASRRSNRDVSDS